MGGTGTPLQRDAILKFLRMRRTFLLYSVKSATVVYLLSFNCDLAALSE